MLCTPQERAYNIITQNLIKSIFFFIYLYQGQLAHYFKACVYKQKANIVMAIDLVDLHAEFSLNF